MNAGLGVTLNFDASTVEPNVAFDPVPSGWYPCIIEESKMEPTRAGDGQMLALTMKILDGEFKGRKLFDRLNLQNSNPATVEIAYKTLSAISRACGIMQVANSQQLHNIPIWVKVKYVGKEADKNDPNKFYDPKNDVKGYDHITQQHEIPTSANAGGATAGGVAGAPQGTPPWAAGQAAPAPAPQQAAPAPAPTYAPPVQQVDVAGAQQPWTQPAQQAAPAPAPAPAAAGAPPWQATAQAAAAAAPAPAPVAPAAPAAPAPPAPQTTGPQMLPAANGIPYESYKAQGWTDEMLIQHGMMAAPVAAAPAPHMVAGTPAPATAAGGPRPPWAT